MPEASGIVYSVHEGGRIDLPPVVLIHGAGGSHLSWPVQLRRMAGQRVLALDLPGHGKSGGFAQQSIPAYADRLHEFLSGLGLPEAVLVGHSMGGAIALTVALKYPQHVTGLGLISSGAYLGVDAAMVEALSNPVTVEMGIARLQQLSFSPSTPPALAEAAMRAVRQSRPSLLLADWLACQAFDLRELAHQVRAPAWVVCGADDRMTPPAYSHFLAARLPGAQVTILPGAGHMAPLEQPEALASGLDEFLSKRLDAIESYRWVLHRERQQVEKPAKE
jgi:pimeloyl-ACP methyl ester carboxylesterase